jgi:hypothetical protein
MNELKQLNELFKAKYNSLINGNIDIELAQKTAYLAELGNAQS